MNERPVKEKQTYSLESPICILRTWASRLSCNSFTNFSRCRSMRSASTAACDSEQRWHLSNHRTTRNGRQQSQQSRNMTCNNAVITHEIKLFQNYFSLRRCPDWNSFAKNYFRALLQLTNIFQHVQCRWNNYEIISASEIILKQFQMWLHVK